MFTLPCYDFTIQASIMTYGSVNGNPSFEFGDAEVATLADITQTLSDRASSAATEVNLQMGLVDVRTEYNNADRCGAFLSDILF